MLLFLWQGIYAGFDLSRYSAYLDGLSTLKASLVQICPNGNKLHGMLYLQKPGKFRLVYEPKGTLELISNGTDLVQYDGRHKESDVVALQDTPLHFLLQKGPLEKLVTLQKVIQGPKWTQIVVQSKSDPHAGVIKLIFQENPLQLVRWIIFDGQGQKTIVTLSHIEKNVIIHPSTFTMQPR